MMSGDASSLSAGDASPPRTRPAISPASPDTPTLTSAIAAQPQCNKSPRERLEPWLCAVRQVLINEMRPRGIGGDPARDEQIKRDAFFGDATLNKAVVVELALRPEGSSLGEMTRRKSQAVSNVMLAEQFSTVFDGFTIRNDLGSAHDRGTMVEAVVNYVDQRPELAKGGAVQALAAFLVDRTSGDTDALGVLCQKRQKLGDDAAGYECEPVEGGLFKATAWLDGKRATATAASKVTANQQAAAEVLAANGVACHAAPKMAVPPTAAPAAPPSGGDGNVVTFKKFEFNDTDSQVKKPESETIAQWFLRGATSKDHWVSRCMKAPQVLETLLQRVEVFQGTMPTVNHTVLCVVTTSKGETITMIGTSTLSKNKAKYAALRQAFIYIVQKLADAEMITKEDEAASLADVERAWAR